MTGLSLDDVEGFLKTVWGSDKQLRVKAKKRNHFGVRLNGLSRREKEAIEPYFEIMSIESKVGIENADYKLHIGLDYHGPYGGDNQ